MNVYQGLRIGVLEIRSHKMQSFLTLFGVAVGVTSVVAMTGIMSGLQNRMAAGIQRSGPGRLFVWPSETTANHSLSGGLVYDDAVAIRRLFPNVPTVSPSLDGADNLFSGNFNAKVKLRGVTPDWRRIDWNYSLRGRFFNETDLETFAKVCVLIRTRHDPREFWRQKDALDPLFSRGDPLGQEVRIGRIAYRVIGVLQEGPRDYLMNFQMGRKNVLIPITSMQKRVTSEKGPLWLIDVDSGDPKTSALLAKRLFALLKRRHRGVSDFKIDNIAKMMSGAMNWADTLATVMGAVAAIALFAGGVGIMNITLASVNARIKEIGIRKSVGAKESDIQMQFLLEAIALSLTGGLVGIALGTAICVAVRALANMAVLPSPASIAVALLMSLGVGVASSWYPARQASRLDPTEALRYE
ncbi:MAG: ABC transporter permease [Elusimicrobiota bacterium]